MGVAHQAVAVNLCVGRSEHRLLLLVGPEPLDLLGELPLLHHLVGSDEETIFVHPGVDRQARDQADVRAFRGLDRADAAVVRNMHVADLEAGSLAVQAAGPKAESLRSWVSIDSGLVWSTTCDSSPRPKKYSMAAEIALRIDQASGRHVGHVLQAHPLLHRAAELQKPLAELVAAQLVDRPQAAIAEIVDVVDPRPMDRRCGD